MGAMQQARVMVVPAVWLLALFALFKNCLDGNGRKKNHLQRLLINRLRQAVDDRSGFPIRRLRPGLLPLLRIQPTQRRQNGPFLAGQANFLRQDEGRF